MIVTKDKVVSLTYELRLDGREGEIVESLSVDAPMVFLYGAGNLLPKFEENIDGLHVGDKFDFNLTAINAYGEIDLDAIVSVPIAAFEIDGKTDENMLRLGNKIPMQDNAGNKLTGVVTEVTNDSVKMDFNHPLAGSDLFFKGIITEVREATEEELHHGHIHAHGGCGGGGCGDCGDSEGGSCGC
jgi:FKBP-type peptidyl-prolyl cis-trans isomerase SlyD